ncbi:YdeI/OmpD-associated family protein [soil metagenome]
MSAPDEDQRLTVTNAAAWRKWLGTNHDGSDGVWLVLAKKGVTEPTDLSFADALDEALCHGWIDGQRLKRDDTTYLQRFTPRRRASTWSKKNVDNVARLIDAGRMQPAGHAEIERAKQDGRWDRAYDSPANATVPPDLATALAASPKAAKAFETLSGRNRFAVIFRVGQAKRDDTRARRIATFVAMLERGETIHPQ